MAKKFLLKKFVFSGLIAAVICSSLALLPVPIGKAHLFAGQALAAESQVEFFVDAYYDISSRKRVQAELFYTSKKAYFYVESNYLDNLSSQEKTKLSGAVKNLADSFDNIIYPEETKLFGDVWNPGIDNDPRITVLFTQLAGGAGGYFNPKNEAPKTQVKDSNEREMVYLNADYVFDPRLKSYLAHEFQHLISYNQKERAYGVVDDVWLNEMRSEYAPTFLGFDAEDYNESNLKRRIDKFNHYPSDSLTEWQGKSYDYPAVNLFGQYLADHYGDVIFQKIIHSKLTGIDSVNEALQELGDKQNFTDVFGDWVVALYLNDASGDKAYGYLSPLLKDIKAPPTARYSLQDNMIIQRVGLMKEWQPLWYEITSSSDHDNDLKLVFKGDIKRGQFKAKILKVDSEGNSVVTNWDFGGHKEGKLLIRHLGKGIKKVVVMPYLAYDGRYMAEKLPYHTFSLTLSSIPGTEVEAGAQEIQQKPSFSEEKYPAKTLFAPLPDGALVRAKGDYKVYVIKGHYKRHLISGKIFGFYAHLNWASVKEISKEELQLYQTSSLIRAAGDKKVYQVDENGVKHWLNMSAQQFSASGKSWDSIYVVNAAERDFYPTGQDITS